MAGGNYGSLVRISWTKKFLGVRGPGGRAHSENLGYST